MEEKLSTCAIDEIVKKYNIQFMVYFGSFQTEFYNSESDIDIAYLSGDRLDADMRMKLLGDLIILHRKSEIDLVDLKTAEPVLRYEVAKNGRILSEKEEGIFERYRLFYIKRFYELAPVIKMQIRQIGDSIKEALADVR